MPKRTLFPGSSRFDVLQTNVSWSNSVYPATPMASPSLSLKNTNFKFTSGTIHQREGGADAVVGDKYMIVAPDWI